MADPKRSMGKFLKLLEAKVKETEDVLTNQVAADTHRPSPRVLGRLEKLEKELEDQYKRMYDKYMIIVSDTDIDEKDEAEVEATHTKAKDIYSSTKSKIEKVSKLWKIVFVTFSSIFKNK